MEPWGTQQLTDWNDRIASPNWTAYFLSQNYSFNLSRQTPRISHFLFPLLEIVVDGIKRFPEMNQLATEMMVLTMPDFLW